MQMRDELFTDERFADMFPHVSQLAESPWRLALVTVMQFAENLTNRQAVDAVRARIDLKYTLSLELTDAGLDISVLREFRKRLMVHSALRGGVLSDMFSIQIAVLIIAVLTVFSGLITAIYLPETARLSGVPVTASKPSPTSQDIA